MSSQNGNTSSTGSPSAAAGHNAVSRTDAGVEHGTTRSKPHDPFLFYSDPENLRRALHFLPVDYSREDSSFANQVERKTRITFEKDPLALMMEDDEFRAWFESDENVNVNVLALAG